MPAQPNDIAAVATAIVSLLGKLAHHMQSQSADPPALNRLIEIRRRAGQWIERLAVIFELDRQLTSLQLERDCGLARRLELLGISVPGQVGKQFFDHDKCASLVIRREPVLGSEGADESVQLARRSGNRAYDKMSAHQADSSSRAEVCRALASTITARYFARGRNMNLIVHSLRSAAGICLGIFFVLLIASSADAQNPPIAQVKTVSGQVTIQRSGASVPVKVGDPLFEKDTIDTGADGAIGVTFIDNTVMSTGPNSEVALEQYRFDSSNYNGSMLTDMRKGTLDMVSGDIAKSSPGAMKIKTPAAILGVRGTHFVVEVPD